MTGSEDHRDPSREDATTAIPRQDPDPAQTPTTRLPADGSAPLSASISSRRLRVPEPNTFIPGDIVSGRYKILRFIAQGGMGEVYEAADMELQEVIAVKTIRPEIAADSQAIERFKREIQLARKVTHPNACRIFDLSRHRDDTGGAADITFLTMELLSGESLADRLKRGPMSTTEALPLVVQMAQALGAAHEAGIIHRDFKPGNVMLVVSRQGARAVVTDFGLARGMAGSESLAAAAATGTGMIVGTPAYMSPEQLEGGEITAGSDIYSLGVVMYEMVTGKWPFVGDSAISTAFKRLKETPAPPRSLNPSLDPLWNNVIMRCLERQRVNRFAAANDIARALSGESVAAGRRSKRRWQAVLVIAIVLALAAGVAVVRRSALKPASTTAPAPAINTRLSIAVLGFKNLSGRPEVAWLSTALSEMLGTELAAGEKLRAIPGEDVARMKIDLSLAEADSYSKDTLSRIRANMGTDYVVLGSYTAIAGQIRLDLRLQDAGKGETIAAVAQEGTEAKLFELVSKAGAELRQKLGVGILSSAEEGVVRASMPQSAEAARFYAEGLDRLRLFDSQAARDRLERAVAAEPGFPLSHAALATVWADLGFDAKSKEEAKLAFELSAGLSRGERLWVEGRHHEANKEWDKAVESYQTLAGFFPDSLEYGLRLAAAQSSAGNARGARQTLARLRNLPPPLANDARIDLAEAKASFALSDYQHQLESAVEAVKKGQAQGARLLVAAARLEEGWAAQKLGDSVRATASYEEARRIYTAAGDRRGEARALNNLGIVHSNQGDHASAKRMYEEALVICRAIDHKKGVATMLNNIANVYSDQGDLAAAKPMYEEALAIQRQIGAKSGEALALNNIAVVINDEGDLAGARKLYEEALAIQRQLGDKSLIALALNNIGILMHTQGDLAGARKMHEEARQICAEIGDKSLRASALNGIGSVLFDGGDLAGARSRFREALGIQEQLGEQVAMADSLFSMAGLEIEEGNPVAAVASLDRAISAFRKDEHRDAEAAAMAALALAQLAQGQLEKANEAVRAATALAGKSEDRRVRLLVAISAARNHAASGKSAEVTAARRSLEGTVAEAGKWGQEDLRLRARLALAETELLEGRADAGHASLAALEKDAHAKGFELIARKAVAASR